MKRGPMALAVVLAVAAAAAAAETTTPTTTTTSTSTSTSTATTAAKTAAAPAEMIAIPGGPFFVGAKGPPTGSEPAGAPPGHAVTVAPFSIDRTEVTAGDFAACIHAGACRSPKFPPGQCVSHKSADCAQDCNINKGPKFARHPMNCATWEAASDYCKWAGKRLPSEVEWERAARGSDGRRFPWGKGKPNKQLCWNHGDPRAGSSCPVGTLPAGASPYGVLDLAGNVAEWTSTSYDSGGKYVVKGGGFFINGEDAEDEGPEWVFRADVADVNAPTRLDLALGFRCARDGATAATPTTPTPAPGTPPDAASASKTTASGPAASHPGPGSPVRKAVLEAIRANLNETVEFKVARLSVVGDWAYFEGQEHKASGRPVGALLRHTDGVWAAEEVVTADASQADAIDKFRARLQGDAGHKLPPNLFER